MTNSVLEYKGYHTRIEFDAETFSVRGKIEGINDYIDFECDRLDGIEAEFHEAVDDYLAFCEEVGKEPDKEYRGSFNVRIDPGLHKELAILAIKRGVSLNSVVEQAVSEYVDGENGVKQGLKASVDALTKTIKSEFTLMYAQEPTAEATKQSFYKQPVFDYSCSFITEQVTN